MVVFETSKSLNFFFFVYTLTGWHFTCREEYREMWLKNINLTQEKESALKELGEVFRKYSSQGKSLGYYLTREGERMRFEGEHNAFGLFRADFEKFWENEKGELDEIVKFLNYEIRNGRYGEIYAKLRRFFGVGKENDFTVIALKPPSAVKNKGGGTAVSELVLTLEVPTLEYARDAGLVVLHEIAHILAKKNRLLKDFRYKSLAVPDGFEGRRSDEIFEEFLMISFLPRGYFNMSEEDAHEIIIGDKKDWRNLNNHIIKNMYDVNKEYIESAREIDADYLEEYKTVLERFFNN